MPGPGYYPPRWKPVVLPDIRLHLTLWQKFRTRTGNWPTTSIVLFSCRFAFVAIGLTITLLLLLRHHASVGPVWAAIYGAIMLFGLAVFISTIFALEQSAKYIGVVFTLALAVVWHFAAGRDPARLIMVAVQITAFAAIWGLLEQLEWNRQLRASGISANEEVWSVTQFPLQEDQSAKPGHV